MPNYVTIAMSLVIKVCSFDDLPKRWSIDRLDVKVVHTCSECLFTYLVIIVGSQAHNQRWINVCFLGLFENLLGSLCA